MTKLIREEASLSTLSRVLSRQSDIVRTALKEPKLRDYEAAGLAMQVVGLNGYNVVQGRELAIFRTKIALDIVFDMVGIKRETYPDPDKFRLLCESIIDAFPTYVVEDIIHAFRCAIEGKYEAETGYQMPNYKYCFPILKAYQQYRYGILTRHEESQQGQNGDDSDIILQRAEQNLTAIKELLIEDYYSFLEGGVKMLSRASGYDYAKRLQLITVSPRARTLIYQKIEQRKYSMLYRLIKHPYDFDEKINKIDQAKKVTLLYQFRKWKKDGITGDDLCHYLNYYSLEPKLKT